LRLLKTELAIDMQFKNLDKTHTDEGKKEEGRSGGEAA
jgi:hypothetical protein